MGPIPEAQTPAGYLFCNGQAVSRTTYSALFNVLGTNFGAGDGSTTFNVPDYRDCFLRGLGTKNNSFYVKQQSAVLNHQHYIVKSVQGNGIPLRNGGGAGANLALLGAAVFRQATDRDDYLLSGGDYTKNTPDAAKTNLPIIGGDTESRPVNYAINYFIKY